MTNFFFFIFLNLREVNYYQWGSVLMIICLLLFVFVFVYQNQRFSALLKLPVSDKYLRVYEEQPLSSFFNVIIFFLKVISFAFFPFFIITKFIFEKNYSFNLYLQLFTIFFVFFVAKILIDKIIFAVFDISHLFEKTLYHRFSYSNAIGLLILPLHFVLYFNFDSPDSVFYIYFGIILLSIVFNYFISILQFFKLILNHHIYFILYICALEIAPLIFIYHLVTRSKLFN